jgi:hypothetical protein
MRAPGVLQCRQVEQGGYVANGRGIVVINIGRTTVFVWVEVETTGSTAEATLLA